MLRQDTSKAITEPAIMKDVFDPNYNLANLTMIDYHSQLIPMYLKITKAKEGSKNNDKYHIFNPLNLRIYDSFSDVCDDMEKYKINNDDLMKDIESIGLVINEDIIFEVDPEDEDIENVLV